MAQPFLGPQWLWATTTLAASTFAFVLCLAPAYAQQDNEPRQKTESPYFQVRNADTGLDALPLKSTDVDVKISGVIADVVVTQVYRNEGLRAIEAKYVFPGATRAAVYGMKVRLGDRVITAKIREKQQARIAYQEAKAEGKTAALLEQHLPNVFQMNVANILPGDEVRVELRYTELLVPEAGNYQFVFPTVVGPRYNSPQSSQAQASWPAQPYLPQGQSTPSRFDMRVALQAPVPLQAVSSTTHKVRVQRESGDDKRAHISLTPDDDTPNNRDFILDYRLAGNHVQSGVMLYRGDTENFFLAMVQPPQSVPSATISPRDYIFVVDISGSMHGFPLNTAKAMLAELIGGLRPSDTFNVLLFAGSSEMLSPRSVPATQANIAQALRTISSYKGGGGTELIPALRRVYAQPKPEDVARTVVVVTDGYVTVESEAFALVRNNLSRANLFSFGIGSSVNRHLMEGLARAGMGEPFIITNPAQAPAQAARFRRMIESPVLTQVSARLEGMDVYDVEPAQLPDLLAERPLMVFGKWRGKPGGKLVIEGRSAQGPLRQTLPIDEHAQIQAQALRYLWARHRIASLGDQDALDGRGSHRDAITALGLQYNLLTDYTSFLAIDQIVRNPNPEASATVKQPLPLPQGVSNLAVGDANVLVASAEVPGTPEPATWGAMGVTLALLAMALRRQRRCRRERFTA
jgi:Ca-activated chloride channel family protein